MIGGGLKDDNDRPILITQGHHIAVPSLNSNNEETDTHFLLYAKHASLDHQRIIIPDTDVAVLCITHYKELNCRELWFQTGVKDNLRYISMHFISQQLGKQICTSLLGFHAVTGCDSISSLAGISKKKALKILLGNISYQEMF